MIKALKSVDDINGRIDWIIPLWGLSTSPGSVLEELIDDNDSKALNKIFGFSVLTEEDDDEADIDRREIAHSLLETKNGYLVKFDQCVDCSWGHYQMNYIYIESETISQEIVLLNIQNRLKDMKNSNNTDYQQ